MEGPQTIKNQRKKSDVIRLNRSFAFNALLAIFLGCGQLCRDGISLFKAQCLMK